MIIHKKKVKQGFAQILHPDVDRSPATHLNLVACRLDFAVFEKLFEMILSTALMKQDILSYDC